MWTETTRIIMRFDRSRIDAYSIFWTSVDRLLDTIIKPLRYNFCTYILLLVLFYILMLTSFVYLYIYLFIYLCIYQEPTDIPSRKKLMRWDDKQEISLLWPNKNKIIRKHELY